MITQHPSEVLPTDDAAEIENEYASVYKSMYAMAYIEREDNKVYKAEDFLIEVV